MPSKKKKYNARFPPARIKKIIQSDEEVGKVAQAVPVIISRALELFVENLLRKAETVTQARNAKTLTPLHLKQCINSERRFDFLKDLVAAIPDVQGEDDLVETPRSSASSSAFLYPAPIPGTSNVSRSLASSTVGAPPDEDEDEDEQEQQQYQQPKIAEYAQGLPFQHHPPPVQQSVIVTQHPQHSPAGYILNSASVTRNPYIPNISGSHHGIGGMYPMYPHPHIQNPNNGMNYSQQSSGDTQQSGVIVYSKDKSVSHHHNRQR